MKKKNGLESKCHLVGCEDKLTEVAEQNSKKELVEYYKSRVNYAGKVLEEDIKLSKREQKELMRDLYNAIIVFEEYK